MPFMAEAYEAKKYAFVSDVMRLIVLEQYGGVYFDTDVEIVRGIKPLLGDPVRMQTLSENCAKRD